MQPLLFVISKTLLEGDYRQILVKITFIHGFKDIVTKRCTYMKQSKTIKKSHIKASITGM